MERYRRIDVNEQQPIGSEARQRAKVSRFVGSSAQHNYYSNARGGQDSSMPPMDYSRHGGAIDSSRHYIPMS